MKPTFGQRMNARRKQLRMTWPQVSQATGVPAQQLRNMAGDRHRPRLRAMTAIAKVFKCRLTDHDLYEASQWELLYDALTEFFSVKEMVES